MQAPFLRHWGQGARKAVMIHCSLAHSGAWAALAGQLSDRLTMTAFDLPGHGRGPDWTPGQDLHAQSTRMAADLVAGGPADLIGHSFGATVALRVALEHPEAVRSLVLIEPVLFAAAHAAGDPAFAAHMRDTAAVDAAWEAGDTDAATRHFIALWGAGTSWDALPEAQRAYMAARIGFIPATAGVLADDSAGLLAPGRLEALRCPVLIVTGTGSPSVMPAIARALAARLSHAQRVDVPGAAHMAPITHPQEVGAAIRRFLETPPR